jgi:two-component system response regulator GlrR
MARATRRTPRILVVDDDPGLLRLLTIRLRSEKYEVEPVDSAAAALEAVARFRPDLVVTDLRMAGMDGIELLKELQRRWPGLSVILLTAHGTIPDAVRATQGGAVAFLTKPVEKDQLLAEVRKALRTSGLAEGVEDWREEFATRSPVLEERLARAHALAANDAAVLITGEPGTGKELLGRSIHRASKRRDRPFEVVESERLLGEDAESELNAAIERARGGSLLVQDIDELPKSVQALLASLLDAAHETHDIRLFATSNRRLEDLAAEDRVAGNLLDGLAGVQLEMPSLERRREDIPLLIKQCLDEVARSTHAERKSCSPEAIERFAAAKWPGNVRQLRALVRQVASICSGPVIPLELVDDALGRLSQVPSFDQARDEFTRNYLIQLLQLTEGNVSQAARLAQRNRTDFYKLLARHGIEPDTFKG